jgi:hypothetical protein
MTSYNDTSRIAWLPAIAGTGLCIGAIALLTSDAFTTGHVTVLHALQPLLIIGAIAAAVQAHRSLSAWRPVSALAFVVLAVLAVLGSLACVYGTLGRMSEARDHKTADALASSRQLTLVNEALQTAKADAARECKTGFGQRCTNAQSLVDKLTADMASQRTASVDPRADSIAKLATLLGFDGERVRAIVEALDPLIIPLFLELGSIVFFASAFPVRKSSLAVTLSDPADESTVKEWSKDEILRDIKRMKQGGAQRFLAARYNVSEATISRLMKEWEGAGHITRQRDGQRKLIAKA